MCSNVGASVNFLTVRRPSGSRRCSEAMDGMSSGSLLIFTRFIVLSRASKRHQLLLGLEDNSGCGDELPSGVTGFVVDSDDMDTADGDDGGSGSGGGGGGDCDTSLELALAARGLDGGL